MSCVHDDAQQIADLLNEGFYKEALDIWEEKSSILKLFEIKILQKEIHKRINNFGKTKYEVTKILVQERNLNNKKS